jgi:hypothetical protein
MADEISMLDLETAIGRNDPWENNNGHLNRIDKDAPLSPKEKT